MSFIKKIFGGNKCRERVIGPSENPDIAHFRGALRRYSEGGKGEIFTINPETGKVLVHFLFPNGFKDGLKIPESLPGYETLIYPSSEPDIYGLISTTPEEEVLRLLVGQPSLEIRGQFLKMRQVKRATQRPTLKITHNRKVGHPWISELDNEGNLDPTKGGGVL